MESEALAFQLKAILDGTQDASWYLDFREGVTTLSPRWYEMLGYEPGEVARTVEGWLGLVHPEDLPAVRTAMEAHLGGQTDQFVSEHRLRRKDGTWLWTLDRGRIVQRSPEGQPLIAAGTHADISHRKQVEAALQASEARFKALANLAPIGIWLSEPERGCTYVNQAWGTLTGRAPEEALRDGWAAALHPDEVAPSFARWQRAAATGEGFECETRFLRPNGNIRWGQVRVRPWVDPSGESRGFLGVVQDITDRKLSEAAQARHVKSLEDLKFALNQAAIVAITDLQDVILEVNDRFTQISGFTREELTGNTHRLVNSGHHPAPFFQALWETITQGKVWQGEIRNRAKDGHTYWVDTTIVPLSDAEGDPSHYLVIHHDVSERHRVEEALEAARAGAESANHLKDRLMAYLSHELKNPLQALQAAAECLELAPPSPYTPRQQGMLDIIRDQSHQMLRFITEVLDSVQAGSGHLPVAIQPVDLGPLFQRVLATLAPMAERKEVSTHRQLEGPCLAMADPRRLEQVLLNLGTNAIKYNRPGGRMLWFARAGEPGWVHLGVSDTGLGIPEARRNDVFGAYQRLGRDTSEVTGTGLGLLLTRTIVERMGGRIGFESREGEGTTFWMALPAPPPA